MDEEVGQRLVRGLPLRRAPEGLWEDIEARLERPRSPLRRRWPLGTALAGVALAGAILLLRTGQPAWEARVLAGTPLLGSAPLRGGGRLGAGDWLRTGANGRVQIVIGGVGQVAVEENTAVQVVRAAGKVRRLALAHGAVQARIWAPPRLFVLDTPSATAVDLGCAYVMQVDSAGRGLLRVTAGQVLLEQRGRESLVVAGADCRTWPGVGPGTPCFEDAPQRLRQALEQFDFEGGGDAALNTVVDEARPRDTLTLWHVLPRVDRPQRDRVYDRIAGLVKLPPELDRAKVLTLDPYTLEWLRNELQWEW